MVLAGENSDEPEPMEGRLFNPAPNFINCRYKIALMFLKNCCCKKACSQLFHLMRVLSLVHFSCERQNGENSPENYILTSNEIMGKFFWKFVQ